MDMSTPATAWLDDPRPPQRTWLGIGTFDVKRLGQERIEAAIAGLRWQRPPATLPFAAAIAVRRVISELALPAVSAVALDHQVAPELLIGVQSHYTDGRARLYVIDRGNDLVPLASDFWPTTD